MSEKICVQFEIRNMLIMKDTLHKLGLNFTEVNENQIEMKRDYHNIVINSKLGNITYDSNQTREVNRIKQAYTVNYYRAEAIKEGMQLREETTAQGEVVLYVTKS